MSNQQAPATAQTSYPHALTPQKRPMSGLAVAGFVCSLLWGFGVLSVVGLALSIAALTDTKKGRSSGRGLAVAGVILGLIGVVNLAVFLVTGVQTWTT